MACFIVPAAGAVVSHFISKHTEHNDSETHISMSRKIGWLTKLLAGGSFLLTFEHVWHGEVTPWMPFLSGAESPAQMISEMATVGIGMLLVVLAVWGVMLVCASRREKALISQTEK